MLVVFSSIKVLFRVLREVYKDFRWQIRLASVMTLSSVFICIFSYFNGTLQKLNDSAEIVVVTTPDNVMIPQPSLSIPTPTLEPTLLPEIDSSFTAVVEVISCELEEPCIVPMWETYERITLTGKVPVGGVVDVISCYYPVVEILSEDVDSELPISTFNSYTLEGLWCETYFLGSDDSFSKGMIQYWHLRILESEELQVTPDA